MWCALSLFLSLYRLVQLSNRSLSAAQLSRHENNVSLTEAGRGREAERGLGAKPLRGHCFGFPSHFFAEQACKRDRSEDDRALALSLD